MRESVLEGLRLAEQGYYRNAADAIGGIAGRGGEDPKLSALLRAYAGSFLYTAYLLSQPADEALMEESRDAFLEALRLDPDLTLPERYFSPRVVSFFDGLRSTAKRP
jgi:hypothetical protein